MGYDSEAKRFGFEKRDDSASISNIHSACARTQVFLLLAFLILPSAHLKADWPAHHYNYNRNAATSASLNPPLVAEFREYLSDNYDKIRMPSPGGGKPREQLVEKVRLNYSSPLMFDFGSEGLHYAVGTVEGRIMLLNQSEDEAELVGSYQTEGPIYSSPSHVYHLGDRYIICGSSDGYLYCLKIGTGGTLSLEWKTKLNGSVYASPAVIKPDGTEYVVIAADGAGVLHAIDSSGGKIGEMSLGGTVWASPVVYDQAGDEVIIVGTYEGKVIAVEYSELIEENDVRLWETELTGAVRYTPALYAGRLYVSTMQGEIYGLNVADGTILWNETLVADSYLTSPVVAPSGANRLVFVCSGEGTLYALREEIDGSGELNIKEAWTDDIGEIYASPVIARDRLYIIERSGTIKSYLVAGAKNEEEEWSSEVLHVSVEGDAAIFHDKLSFVDQHNGLQGWGSTAPPQAAPYLPGVWPKFGYDPGCRGRTRQAGPSLNINKQWVAATTTSALATTILDSEERVVVNAWSSLNIFDKDGGYLTSVIPPNLATISPYHTPLIAYNGNLYFGDSKGYIHEVDLVADLGRIKTSVNVSASRVSFLNITSDGYLCVPTIDNGLVIINSNDFNLFNKREVLLPNIYHHLPTAVDENGNIFIHTKGDPTGHLYKINQEGTILWELGLFGFGNASNRIAVRDDGNVYFTSGGEIHLIDGWGEDEGTVIRSKQYADNMPGQFAAIAISPQGNVVLSGATKVWCFKPELTGNPIYTFFNAGKPVHIDRNGLGYLPKHFYHYSYIVDVFDTRTGDFVTQSQQMKMAAPGAVIIGTEGNLYMTASGRLIKFSGEQLPYAALSPAGTMVNGEVEIAASIPAGTSYELSYIADGEETAIADGKSAKKSKLLGKWQTDGLPRGSYKLHLKYGEGKELYTDVEIGAPEYEKQFDTAGETEFVEPIDVCGDAYGGFYVADSAEGRITRYDSLDELLGNMENDADGVAAPVNVATDGEGKLYVADKNNARVRVFDAQGQLLSDVKEIADRKLESPLAVDISDGKLYVLDAAKNGYWILGTDLRGKEARLKLGKESEYSDLAVSDAGVIYLANVSKGRVEKADIRRKSAKVFGSEYLTRPSGIYLADGLIYVTDAASHQVVKFGRFGNHLMSFGGYGIGEGEFDTPSAVSVNDEGAIYVADSGNKRVQKFKRSKFVASSSELGKVDELTITDVAVMPSIVASGTNVIVSFSIRYPVSGILYPDVTVSVEGGQIIKQTGVLGTNRTVIDTLGLLPGEYLVNISASDGSAQAETQTRFAISVPGTYEQPATGDEQLLISRLHMSNDPFAPRKGETTGIIYQLSVNAEVSIVISDSHKKPVWAGDYLPGINGGKQGDNAVLWDGRRNRGDKIGEKVQPGIYYVSVIASVGGETVSAVTSVLAVPH